MFQKEYDLEYKMEIMDNDLYGKDLGGETVQDIWLQSIDYLPFERLSSKKNSKRKPNGNNCQYEIIRMIAFNSVSRKIRKPFRKQRLSKQTCLLKKHKSWNIEIKLEDDVCISLFYQVENSRFLQLLYN